MLQELQQFGLSLNEAKVYLAALEVGRATADQLSKHAGVKRPTTYVQLESLMENGLMSKYEEGKKTYYAPESPDNLRRLFEQQKSEFAAKEQELQRSLPELSRMFEGAGERPIVRFFQGKEGIVTMRQQMLNAPAKKWLVIYSHDALDAVFPKEERRGYSERRIERGIVSKIIYTREKGPFAPSDLFSTQATERKFFPPNKLPLETDIVIFGNTVALTSLRGTLFSVVVESKEIARSHAALFWALWNKVE